LPILLTNIDNDVSINNYMRVFEVVSEAKPTKADCKKPADSLSASWLASCKSRGLKARDGDKSHKLGKTRVKVGGKKIRGKKYGGPLPDWGSRK
jgi:hypothetical protein